jgi:hypothetical protein
VALREACKAIINEGAVMRAEAPLTLTVYHFGAALATATSVLFLMLFHRQGTSNAVRGQLLAL